MGNLWSRAEKSSEGVQDVSSPPTKRAHVVTTSSSSISTSTPSTLSSFANPDAAHRTADIQDEHVKNAEQVLASWSAANASYVSTKRLTDTDAHITEYISGHEGFTAVIKQRYADFQVIEIMPDGHLTTLTTTIPPDFEEGQEESGDKNKTDPVFDEAKIEQMRPHLTNDEIEQLKDLHVVKPKSKESPIPRVVLPCSDDRDERTQLHQLIKDVFPRLYSKTLTPDVDDDGVPSREPGRSYRVEVTYAGGSSADDQHRRRDRRQDRGQFCHFTLCKENIDTISCARLIARKLRCKPKEISFAGTKDKRGITTQRMCIKRVRAPRLASLNRLLRGVTLGDFTYSNECLRLGDHSGNRFEIVLRNCTGSDQQIEEAMTSLKTHGFINYFGMQRFGVGSVPTHAVGLALLRKNFEQAVDLLLPPNAGLDPVMDKACQYFHDTGDIHRTLVMMPRKYDVERGILQVLKKNNRDFVTALQTVPRNQRMIYIHAYQSLIWNKVVSQRVHRFGLEVLIGDLVYDKDVHFDGMSRDERRKSVIFVTNENKDRFTIHDVLMPIPAHGAVYPKNEVHEMFREALAVDGLDIDNQPSQILECALFGDFRRMIALPTEVTWQTLRYDDPHIPLIASPVDLLEAKESGKEVRIEDVPTGKYRALLLGFNLDVSCYATMALREILKTPTDKAYQTSLNAYADEDAENEGDE
eukprot:m.49832 g.49832  ORF g.49832 m.49832 type:complete len:697 (-) comp12504_c0_seq1:2188-4278(-)